MHKRSVGLLLGLTLTIALVTLYQDYRFDRLIASERASALARDRDLGALGEQAVGLHAAQAAAVATGQAPNVWLTQADGLSASLRAAVDRVSASAPEPMATQYGAIRASLEETLAVDRRVRAALSRGDRLVAADLVFMDAAEATRVLRDAIGAARGSEAGAADTRIARFSWLRLGMNFVALLFAVAVAAYFGRALGVLGQASPPTMAEMLKGLPPPVRTGQAPATAAAAQAGSASSPAPPAQPEVNRAAAGHTAHLTAAADLCVDLARVLDNGDLPALLERTAALLDAKGVVLWAADTGGTTLRPSLSHGYPAKVLAKLRPIQLDADNVTARAFRSLEPQALSGTSPTESGAIAVPLVTGGGCVGVMAAETRQHRLSPELLPVARILAAQFSALVAPMETVAPPRSAQG